jgi:hypothetical protein
VAARRREGRTKVLLYYKRLDLLPLVAYAVPMNKGPDRNCEYCNEIIPRGRNVSLYSTRRFCNRKCSARWLGANHSRVVRERKECERCGAELRWRHNDGAGIRSKRRFCSIECRIAFMVGDRGYNWRGGRRPKCGGYIWITVPGKGRIAEHRHLAEIALGRRLKQNETVHHINLLKHDNRHENLLVCSISYHRWLHEEMARRWVADNITIPAESYNVPWADAN